MEGRGGWGWGEESRIQDVKERKPFKIVQKKNKKIGIKEEIRLLEYFLKAEVVFLIHKWRAFIDPLLFLPHLTSPLLVSSPRLLYFFADLSIVQEVGHFCQGHDQNCQAYANEIEPFVSSASHSKEKSLLTLFIQHLHYIDFYSFCGVVALMRCCLLYARRSLWQAVCKIPEGGGGGRESGLCEDVRCLPFVGWLLTEMNTKWVEVWHWGRKGKKWNVKKRGKGKETASPREQNVLLPDCPPWPPTITTQFLIPPLAGLACPPILILGPLLSYTRSDPPSPPASFRSVLVYPLSITPVYVQLANLGALPRSASSSSPGVLMIQGGGKSQYLSSQVQVGLLIFWQSSMRLVAAGTIVDGIFLHLPLPVLLYPANLQDLLWDELTPERCEWSQCGMPSWSHFTVLDRRWNLANNI